MRFSLFVIVCSFLVAGCSYQQADKVAPLENSFKEGEKFRVTLPEDHTTGYMWQINHNYDESVLDYYGSVFRGNEKGVDFNFTALKKGKTRLNFTLIKYRDTSEVRQVIIDIK